MSLRTTTKSKDYSPLWTPFKNSNCCLGHKLKQQWEYSLMEKPRCPLSGETPTPTSSAGEEHHTCLKPPFEQLFEWEKVQTISWSWVPEPKLHVDMSQTVFTVVNIAQPHATVQDILPQAKWHFTSPGLIYDTTNGHIQNSNLAVHPSQTASDLIFFWAEFQSARLPHQMLTGGLLSQALLQEVGPVFLVLFILCCHKNVSRLVISWVTQQSSGSIWQYIKLSHWK